MMRTKRIAVAIATATSLIVTTPSVVSAAEPSHILAVATDTEETADSTTDAATQGELAADFLENPFALSSTGSSLLDGLLGVIQQLIDAILALADTSVPAPTPESPAPTQTTEPAEPEPVIRPSTPDAVYLGAYNLSETTSQQVFPIHSAASGGQHQIAGLAEIDSANGAVVGTQSVINVGAGPTVSDYEPRLFQQQDGSEFSVSEYPIGGLTSADGWVWSSRGTNLDGSISAPAIIEMIDFYNADKQGHVEVARYAIPSYHLPDADGTQGVRHLKGPGALAHDWQESRVIAINEQPLIQDGQANSTTSPTFTRVTTYNPESRQPIAEYALAIEPLAEGEIERGITGILVAGFEDFEFVLEQGLRADGTTTAEIYKVNLDGATNVLGKQALDGSETPVRKELVLNLTELIPNLGDTLALSGLVTDSDPSMRSFGIVSSDSKNPDEPVMMHEVAYAKN